MGGETYASARERLLCEAEAAGWKTQRRTANAPWKPLKAPRITIPVSGKEGAVIELRAQSAGFLDSQLSLWVDYRNMSLDQLAERTRRMLP